MLLRRVRVERAPQRDATVVAAKTLDMECLLVPLDSIRAVRATESINIAPKKNNLLVCVCNASFAFVARCFVGTWVVLDTVRFATRAHKPKRH
jgi:hypothetical protein